MSSSKSVGASVKHSAAASLALREASHFASAESKYRSKEKDTSACAIQVMQKLKSSGQYKDVGGNELLNEAKHLVSMDELFCDFSHLLDLTNETIEGTYEEEVAGSFVSSCERLAARKRRQMRFDNAVMLKLSVCLRPLKRYSSGEAMAQDNTVVKIARFLDMDFSAKHAAVLVDDVLLDWNDSNLVVPRKVTEVDKFTFEGEVQQTGKYFNTLLSKRPSLDEELKPFGEEGEILCRCMETKQEMIEKIIAVVVKYNSFYYYDKVARNCQDFVNEIIKVVEVEGQRFSDENERYLHQVREGIVRIGNLYRSHEELDEVVGNLLSRRKLSELNQEEFKILKDKYEQFHHEGKCTKPSCKYELVLVK